MHSNWHSTVHFLKRFHKDERGVIAIMTAILMIVLVGFAALAIDGGYIYLTRTQLQATADAASLAGTQLIPDKNNGTLTGIEEDDIITEAQTFALKNMPSAKHGTVLASVDVVPGFWDKEGLHGDARKFYGVDDLPSGEAIDAVHVTTRRSSANGNALGLFFARILGFHEMDITAQAVGYAGGGGGDEACILALNPVDDGSIQMSGSNSLDLGGCGMAMHSTSPKAMKLSGTEFLDGVTSICMPGDPGVEESGSTTWTPLPTFLPGCTPPADPLAGIAQPTVSGCDYTDVGLVTTADSPAALEPGVYCDGIEITGSNTVVDFAPGVYIILEKGLKISGSGNIINERTIASTTQFMTVP